MGSRSLSCALIALGVLSVSSGAADLRFGLSATVAKPGGDIANDAHLDGKLGHGFGASLQVDLGEGWAITPRVDYTTAKRSRAWSKSFAGVDFVGSSEMKAEAWMLGADGSYHFSGATGKGFYALAGLGYASTRLKVHGFAPAITGAITLGNAVATFDESETKGSLCAAVGVGYDFTRHLGAQLRYVALTKYEGVSEEFSGPSLNASFIVRF